MKQLTLATARFEREWKEPGLPRPGRETIFASDLQESRGELNSDLSNKAFPQ